MAPIVVDPDALAGAGEAVTTVGDELSTAIAALSSGLGGGAPSGLDPSGLAFGMAYQKSAQALLDAGAALVNASRNVGFGVGMSATNYSQANAASTIGGGTATLTAPEKPTEFATPSSPPSLGGGVPPPFLWSVLQTFIPDTWPDGDPARLRDSAEAWQTFASAINGIAVGLSGPSGVIAGQKIPEGGAMTSAMAELSRSLSEVATEAGNLATQIREFADDVQATQDAIRDLCDRVSPSGIFDGIKAVFSGDALEEIKEIADDVKEVLENFGRQADGRISLMESLITALDDAVVSMQQSARREFTHYLGDDVGGALATAFEFHSNVGEGIIKGGLETVVGVQQLDPARFASDPEAAGAAWGGVLDTLKYATPTGVAMDPSGALDHGKDMLGGIVHAEDWRADRPGLGLGGVLFEAGSAVTGVGAAKTGLRGAGAAADAGEAGPVVRAAAGAADATAPIAGHASEIASKLEDLTTLADDLSSGAGSGAKGPALPPSLAEPGVPRISEGSRLPESAMPHGLPHSTPDSGGPHPADLSSQPSPEGGGSRAEVPPQAVPDTAAPRSAEPGSPQVSPSTAASTRAVEAPSPSGTSLQERVGPGAGSLHAALAPEPRAPLASQGATGENWVDLAPPASSSSQPHPSVPHDPTPTSSDSSTVSGSGASDGSGHHPDSAEPHLRDDGVPDPPRWDQNVLSEETRDEIQAMDKGTRPDPSEYLPQEFIEHHLERFDDGASRFMTAEALEDYGIGHRDGTTFVFPTRELETLMEATGGDRRALEQALGLPDGYFETDGVVRVDVPEPSNFDLRIPSGNEAGANEQWIPGGFLPTGIPEAVIDGADVPPGDLTITDIDGR
ncbi:hypothetical protein AU195_09130 [Mycobacterium sp. IS-1496]|uniref:WXG100-like domain-containing protein n=1 Tax=Mycobacterium sp. IS-1496 TaxID=1772284 RepID=UPI00074155FB|nr:ESX-1 secretion-associated protein [Mycobacterium sp. IS-1496]KUI34676.1 hypothetical protein AU195_09130 [Mycobacterium sp. IS-1496]